MKKLLIFLFCLTILNSCGSSTTDSTTKVYTGTGFTINIPNSWVDAGSKDIPNIQHGKIELALTSAEITAGFANNLVILSEDVSSGTTSTEYFNTNFVRTTEMLGFKGPLSNNVIRFSDNDESKVVTYEAKYAEKVAPRLFWQTTKICGNKAYLMTIGVELDNKKTSYGDLFKSFECAK